MQKLIVGAAILIMLGVLVGCQKQKARIELEPEIVTIEVNQDYDLLTGVKAYDKKDKDISEDITIEYDGFNIYFEGTYHVTYQVKDISATRTIVVKDSSDDDAPLPSNSNDIVVKLNDYQVTKAQLYDRMKKQMGLQTILQMIDNQIYEDIDIEPKDLEDHYGLLVEQYGVEKLSEIFTELGYYQAAGESDNDYHGRLLDYLKQSHIINEALRQEASKLVTDADITQFKEDYFEDRCVIIKDYNVEQEALDYIESLTDLDNQGVIDSFSEDYTSLDQGEDDSFFSKQITCDYDRAVYRTLSNEEMKTHLFETIPVGGYSEEPFEFNNRFFVFYVAGEAEPKAGYDDVEFTNQIKEELTTEKLTSEYKMEVQYQKRDEVQLKIYDPYLATQYKSLYPEFSGISTTDNDSLVASINGLEITTDSFYDKLAQENAAPAMLKELNYYSLQTIPEISLTNADETAIKSQVNEVTNRYISSGFMNYNIKTWDYLMNYFGVPTREELNHKYALDYFASRYILGFNKDGVQVYDGVNPVTEVQINEMAFSATVRHILFSFENNTKEEAYNKALEVINGSAEFEDPEFFFTGLEQISEDDLENRFSGFASIYSDDRGTENNNNGLVTVTPGVTVEPFEDAVKELLDVGVNNYTPEPVETEFGYHVIYLKSINDTLEKPDGYDEITQAEMQEILTNHTNNEVESYYRYITPIIQKLNEVNLTQRVMDQELAKLRNSLQISFNDEEIKQHYLAINNLYLN